MDVNCKKTCVYPNNKWEFIENNLYGELELVRCGMIILFWKSDFRFVFHAYRMDSRWYCVHGLDTRWSMHYFSLIDYKEEKKWESVLTSKALFYSLGLLKKVLNWFLFLIVTTHREMLHCSQSRQSKIQFISILSVDCRGNQEWLQI